MVGIGCGATAGGALGAGADGHGQRRHLRPFRRRLLPWPETPQNRRACPSLPSSSLSNSRLLFSAWLSTRGVRFILHALCSQCPEHESTVEATMRTACSRVFDCGVRWLLQVQYKTLNPTWNETFVFELPFPTSNDKDGPPVEWCPLLSAPLSLHH